MNNELRESILHLIESQPGFKQGQKADMAEMLRLNQECGGAIPEWLIELVTTYPLCGAEFGWEDPDLEEDDAENIDWSHWSSYLLYLTKSHEYDKLAFAEWSTPAVMREAMLEMYPGIALLKMGYINVAHDSSSGDPYFVPTDHGDNPPLFVVSSCAPADLDSLQGELNLVCEKLSDFFLRIKKIEILSDRQ